MEMNLIEQNGVLYANSCEVAEIVGRWHGNLVRDIEYYISTISENSDLSSQDFFIESSYKVDGNNKTYKCYLLTKKGCGMVVNKMTGEKGILFTATEIGNILGVSANKIGKLSKQLDMKI